MKCRFEIQTSELVDVLILPKHGIEALRLGLWHSRWALDACGCHAQGSSHIGWYWPRV